MALFCQILDSVRWRWTASPWGPRLWSPQGSENVNMILMPAAHTLAYSLCGLHHPPPCNNLTDESHPPFRWIMDGKCKCKMYFQSLLCSGNDWELSELGSCISNSYRDQVASSGHTSWSAQFQVLACSQKQMLAEKGNEERSHAGLLNQGRVGSCRVQGLTCYGCLCAQGWEAALGGPITHHPFSSMASGRWLWNQNRLLKKSCC